MATRAYNPAAYVRGGASSAVAQAIQKAGYATPGATPIQVPTVPTLDTSLGGGGTDGGGGGGFDFNTDPGYLAALAAEQAGSAQLDAALRAQREAALVNFGDPSLAGAFGLDNLDPLTAAMAQQATTSGVSTLAQLQRSRDLSQQSLQNNLAAHGMINSGDLGWRTGQNQQNYGTALYNAQQGAIGALNTAAQNAATQKAGLHTNVVNALTSAYNAYVGNPNDYGMVTTPAASGMTQTGIPATPSYIAPPKPQVQTQYGYTGGGTMGGWNYPTAPVSRLATPSPVRFQTARNVRAG